MATFYGVSQGSRTSKTPILVGMLHSPGAASLVERMIAAWHDAVPQVTFAAFAVPDNLDSVSRATLAAELRVREASPSHLVLVGLDVAQYWAIQLALTGPQPICRGVLGCGPALLRPAVEPSGSVYGAKLRLAWEAPAPELSAAAMSQWLSVARAKGVDAQGSELVIAAAASRGAAPSEYFASPSMIRLTRAYLAELVAVAIHSP